jgi:D-xylose transport system substrate-binding protein
MRRPSGPGFRIREDAVMVNKTRTWTALAGTMVIIAASACSSTASPSKAGGGSTVAGKIAFLMPCSTCAARFETQDKPGFIKAVQKLDPSIQVIANNAQGSDATQISQAESAITNGAKVIVISPLDETTGKAIVAKAAAAKIPVIAYDGLLTGAKINFYVSFDPAQVGNMQGQFVVAHAARGSNIVMINGDQTADTGRHFKQGALAALNPAFHSGALKLAYTADTPQFDPSKAQQEMEAALTRLSNKVGGVLVANDGMAAGVVAALMAQHLAGKAIVTGQDATVAGLQRILTGTQSMTVYKSIPAEAQAAAVVAVGLIRGKSNAVSSVAKTTVSNGAGNVPSLLLQPVVITKSNVSVVVNDGGASWKQVCAGIPAADCPQS